MLRVLSWFRRLKFSAGGFGVSFATFFALPAFLTSYFGASDFLTTISSKTLEDVTLKKTLANWQSLTREQESPLEGTRKIWTQHVYEEFQRSLS